VEFAVSLAPLPAEREETAALDDLDSPDRGTSGSGAVAVTLVHGLEIPAGEVPGDGCSSGCPAGDGA
jgi:hypothetical protein